MSKIEERVATILSEAGIKYEREKSFSDLRGGLLRYDFYLPELGILYEVDSMLHFEPISKFHKTKHDFQHAQQNDRLKNSYALSHNIPLYRLPEWEFGNIKVITDLMQSKFRVTTKWWNDIVWRQHQQEANHGRCDTSTNL